MPAKTKYMWLILAIFILIGAGFFIFRKRIKAHFIPLVEQSGKIHIKVKNDTSYISTELVVKNRSFFRINIDSIKYTVSLFDKTYLKGRRSLDLSLPGYGSDSVDFSLKIPYAAILKDLKYERKTEDSAGYEVNVFLQYSTFLGNSQMPVNRSGKLKIPRPPELKIEEVRWEKIRLRSLLADVKVKITNHTAVSLTIKKMHYSMDIIHHGKLKGNYNNSIHIKPNEVTFVNVPINITTQNVGKTIFQVLMDRDTYDYTLTLHAVLESQEPDRRSFDLDLTKSGKVELKK